MTQLPPPLPKPPATRRPATVMLAALCMLAGLAVSADVLWHGRLYQADALIARRVYVHMMNAPAAISFWSAISRLGDLPFWGSVAVVVAIVLLLLARIRLLLVWVIGLAGSAALAHIMNAHFAEPRTLLFSQLPLDDTFTYPSSHLMAAVTLFGLMAYLLTYESPRLKWLWLLAAILIILTVAASLLFLGALFGPQPQSPKPPQPGFPVVT
jgi:membrane-associated phospholipid phosphatase